MTRVIPVIEVHLGGGGCCDGCDLTKAAFLPTNPFPAVWIKAQPTSDRSPLLLFPSLWCVSLSCTHVMLPDISGIFHSAASKLCSQLCCHFQSMLIPQQLFADTPALCPAFFPYFFCYYCYFSLLMIRGVCTAVPDCIWHIVPGLCMSDCSRSHYSELQNQFKKNFVHLFLLNAFLSTLCVQRNLLDPIPCWSSVFPLLFLHLDNSHSLSFCYVSYKSKSNTPVCWPQTKTVIIKAKIVELWETVELILLIIFRLFSSLELFLYQSCCFDLLIL